MIAGLVSIAVVTAVTTIGQTINTYFMEMIVPFL
jgi:Flp pilus assembly pilin Flp